MSRYVERTADVTVLLAPIYAEDKAGCDAGKGTGIDVPADASPKMGGIVRCEI